MTERLACLQFWYWLYKICSSFVGKNLSFIYFFIFSQVLIGFLPHLLWLISNCSHQAKAPFNLNSTNWTFFLAGIFAYLKKVSTFLTHSKKVSISILLLKVCKSSFILYSLSFLLSSLSRSLNSSSLLVHSNSWIALLWCNSSLCHSLLVGLKPWTKSWFFLGGCRFWNAIGSLFWILRALLVLSWWHGKSLLSLVQAWFLLTESNICCAIEIIIWCISPTAFCKFPQWFSNISKRLLIDVGEKTIGSSASFPLPPVLSPPAEILDFLAHESKDLGTLILSLV